MALASARSKFEALYEKSAELKNFNSHLNDDFHSLPETKIASSGYVLHTLHASLWCLLTTDSFPACVLKAVNLGGDSDTTGCVAGGLAGLAYGKNSIPPEWIDQLARSSELQRLFHDFAGLCDESGHSNGSLV
jgi:ADP-ribosylglycohydrolase